MIASIILSIIYLEGVADNVFNYDIVRYCLNLFLTIIVFLD